jgi:acyl dehydratase
VNLEQVSAVCLEVRQKYSFRDTILYALGLGVGGSGPLAASELKFVYEKNQRTLPTMAVVLASPGFWLRDPKYAIAWERVLHGEQSILMHREIPAEGVAVGVTRISRISDKGADKGALLYTSKEVFDDKTGDRLATVSGTLFLRGDGGFGGKNEPAPKPYAVPEDRGPDHVLEFVTHPAQALLYRLSGDLNPIHVDPEIAAKVGLAKPILHGLCTYGIAGRAVLAALCQGDPARLGRFDARFVSPVFPGETIVVDVWSESAGRAAVRGRVKERDVVVLSNGRVDIQSSESMGATKSPTYPQTGFAKIL